MTLSNPKDFEGRAYALEILITRDQGGFARLGEGGGKAIGVGEVVLGLEARGGRVRPPWTRPPPRCRPYELGYLLAGPRHPNRPPAKNETSETNETFSLTH